jgi:hypothetical protein
MDPSAELQAKEREIEALKQENAALLEAVSCTSRRNSVPSEGWHGVVQAAAGRDLQLPLLIA